MATYDKTKPAGTESIQDSDQLIRANFVALQDALTREHTFPGSPGSTDGKHAAITTTSITNSGNIVLSASSAQILSNTSDASDNKLISIVGGGGLSSSRGAYIKFHGNEHANTGILELSAGNVTGGVIDFYSGGSKRMTLDKDGYLSMTNQMSFSVYKSASQTIPNITTTKITWNTEDFDTNSNFASNKFTATIAGKYLFSVTVDPQISLTTAGKTETITVYLYKNGASIKQISVKAITHLSTPTGASLVLTAIEDVSATDYFEVYVHHNNGDSNTLLVSGGATLTRFSGSILR